MVALLVKLWDPLVGLLDLGEELLGLPEELAGLLGEPPDLGEELLDLPGEQDLLGRGLREVDLLSDLAEHNACPAVTHDSFVAGMQRISCPISLLCTERWQLMGRRPPLC